MESVYARWTKNIMQAGLAACLLLCSTFIPADEAKKSESRPNEAVDTIPREFIKNNAPLKFRGLIIITSFNPNQPVNKAEWSSRLTAAKRDGYNAIVWLVTGCEVMGGNHSLLKLEAFPEGHELPPDQLQKNIEAFKWLLGTAKENGLSNILYTTSIYYPVAFARAHKIDHEMTPSSTVTPSHNSGSRNCGVRSELTRRYTEEVFREFSTIYQDLDGFYSPIGEAVPGDRASFFREAIAPGLKKSGRKPLMIVHQWQVPLKDYIRDVVPKEVYDNTWLGFHTYDGEQLTDAKPYPGVIQWMEETGLPTIPCIYPAQTLNLPFNSPRFAWEVVQELKKVEGFAGFVYWEMSRVQMSDLFRKALGHYASSRESYSEEPWLKMLESQYGNRQAAENFLKAFDLSTRIIPEMCALVYHPADVQRRELRLPYRFLTGNNGPDSWMSSLARGEKLIPVPLYARFASSSPERFRRANGDEADYQEARWSSHGGSVFDVVPETHMAKVRSLGEQALMAAEDAMKSVKSNQEEAKRAAGFIKAYKLLADYYEQKVLAAISALIYAQSRRPEDKADAEKYADETLRRYELVAQQIQTVVDPINEKRVGKLSESGKTFPELLEIERQERKELAKIFAWPQ